MQREIKAAPSLERLKELLDYDPMTGTFTWRQDLGTRSKAGGIAGGVDGGGYIRISFDGQIYPAHRLAVYYVYGQWGPTVKHRNGDKTDNSIANLSVTSKDRVVGYKNAPEVTVEHLRQVLDYNPETGVFLWKVATSSRSPIGSVAGTINKAGYRFISIDGRKYLAHRLAWLHVHGVWPSGDIDHVNRIKTDNRLINLREATRTQNNVNSKVRSDNTSGHRGVTWHRGSQKWRATVHLNGKQYQVGMFEVLEDAVEAQKVAQSKLHKEFSNFDE